MKRSGKVAAAVAGAATLLAIGVSASAQSASSAAVSAQPAAQAAVVIPSSLTPPPGNKLVKTMTVLGGSQVYTCTAGAWTLLEPVSVLHAGHAFVLNTKGPA